MDEPPHRSGLLKAVQSYRREEIAALLVLRDEDDRCPKQTAPAAARTLASLALPFPVGLVLFKPEYEVLFLPCVEQMAGRRVNGRAGLRADAHWTAAHWEARRDVKGWLSSQFVEGKSYKPTLDQEPLTRMLDLDVIRRAEVPCFGTLERALVHLHEHWAQPGVVYPPPARGSA